MVFIIKIIVMLQLCMGMFTHKKEFMLDRYILYIIALLYATLFSFLEIMPINSAEHFGQILQISQSEFVKLAAIFFIFYAILQVPNGLIFDKYGLKTILPLGILITAIGLIIYTFCTSSLTLVVSRSLSGIGCSMAYIAAAFIAVKYLPLNRLAIFIGLIEATMSIGGILASNVFHFVLLHIGWEKANLLIVGISIILFILSIIYSRRVEQKSEKLPTQTIGELFNNLRQLFQNKTLIAILIYSFSTWLIIMSFAGYWLKDYLIHVHKFSETISLNFVQLYWASFLIFSILFGGFAKARYYKFMLITLSFISCVNFMIMAIPIVFDSWGIAIVVILGGLSTTGMIFAIATIPYIVKKEIAGTAVALNETFTVLGGYVGQVTFGIIHEHRLMYSFLEQHGINLQYYTSLLMYPIAALIAFIAATVVVKSIKVKL